MTVTELAARFRNEMVPLGKIFSYFAAFPVAEEDSKPYLQDPIAALPPALCKGLPKVGIVLAPFLEKGNGRGGPAVVTFERPAEPRRLASYAVVSPDYATLFFALKEEQVSDYHHAFFSNVAALAAEDPANFEKFQGILREELSTEVHGEVDEESWRLKQSLLRRNANVHKDSKLFREYARQAFIDTMTLYLHGICCDIDVERGPRQIASRSLRKRLELLRAQYPPPDGCPVFPEDLNRR